ncbi:Xaa-Pro peptidase family protein [Salinibacterium sp. ZJ70]|uniref:M24 family metallopeptidase n=1 Tax=Salinibacterium sp. ZJ70 TaxID=2708084 RepID=UPI001422F67B|nr:M24 family metallopeptidase [Salinibacterium sp. ZJ70]
MIQPNDVTGDRSEKLARIRSLLDAHDAPHLTLVTPENLTWLFDGARVQVPYGGAAIMRAVVDRDGRITAHAFANEIDRLAAEELGGLSLHPVPWDVSLPSPVPGGLIDRDLVAEMRALRAVLLAEERARYAALGAEAANAVSAVLREARPEHTERALAAELARALVAIGAEPVVLLVGGHGRRAHRHPLPTDALLGRRALAVVGARRHGLVVSFSRWVRFEPSDAGERDVEERLLLVEADAFAATRAGRTLAEVLADVRAAYARHGFDADEWTRHHQGGPAGYLGRDPRATLDTHDIVLSGQAFAWNPTAEGAKIEDTVIVDADGVHVLTRDPSWPVRDVRGVPRPLELEL